MPTKITDDNQAPELLYHVKRTIIDFELNASGANQTTDILKTYTDLGAAKTAAHSALLNEGYLKDDFEKYEEYDESKSWEHGDGVIVFAKAPAGQVFEVRLDTKPNALNFKINATSSEVESDLYYVLQTTIFYNQDSTGGIQSTEVEGTHTSAKAAVEAAKNALLDENTTKKSFAEYDEKDSSFERGEWPYGDEVVVHAVGVTGENFKILVKAQHSTHSHEHLEELSW